MNNDSLIIVWFSLNQKVYREQQAETSLHCICFVQQESNRTQQIIKIQHDKNMSLVLSRWHHSFLKLWRHGWRLFMSVMVQWRFCDGSVMVQWRFCDGSVMVQWRFCDGSVMVQWRFCVGSVMVLWWFCYGPVKVLWWSSDSSVMFLWWSSDGAVLVLSWFCDGPVLVQCWFRSSEKQVQFKLHQTRHLSTWTPAVISCEQLCGGQDVRDVPQSEAHWISGRSTCQSSVYVSRREKRFMLKLCGGDGMWTSLLHICTSSQDAVGCTWIQTVQGSVFFGRIWRLTSAWTQTGWVTETDHEMRGRWFSVTDASFHKKMHFCCSQVVFMLQQHFLSELIMRPSSEPQAGSECVWAAQNRTDGCYRLLLGWSVDPLEVTFITEEL